MNEAPDETTAFHNAKSTMHADTEKAEERMPSHCRPLPYTHWERFVEGFVHPVCAVSLCIFTTCSVLLGLHMIFLGAYYAEYKTLVPAAFRYNKATHVPDDAKFNFNIRDIGLSMGFGAPGILVALGALFLAYITWTVPREKLFQNPLPLLKYMKHLRSLVACQTTFGLALYIYLSYYHDLDPENASGCYTYTNSRGRLIAKCSVESAACFTDGWPDSVQIGHAAQLCTEARILKWMAVAVVPCAAALLLVYGHLKSLAWRNTTPRQRLEMEERQKEDDERVKAVEEEKFKRHKWYYVAWGLFSMMFTAWNIRTIVKED